MMTNAELQAAIEWVHGKLPYYPNVTAPEYPSIKSSGTKSPTREDNLLFDHFTELLKIQRERAAEKEGVPSVTR